MVNVVSALGNAAAQVKKAQEQPAEGAQGQFATMVQNVVQDTANAQRTAEAMSIAVANGENVPMHQVIEAISRAELTLQTMVSVRDKAVEAYQEVLRMPI